MQSPAFPDDYRKKFWEYAKTQTGVYCDEYLKSDPFFYTFNTSKKCFEVLDYGLLERYFLKKEDFEKFWEQCNESEFKKFESLKKLEGKWRYVWWITRTLMR